MNDTDTSETMEITNLKAALIQQGWKMGDAFKTTPLRSYQAFLNIINRKSKPSLLLAVQIAEMAGLPLKQAFPEIWLEYQQSRDAVMSALSN